MTGGGGRSIRACACFLCPFFAAKFVSFTLSRCAVCSWPVVALYVHFDPITMFSCTPRCLDLNLGRSSFGDHHVNHFFVAMRCFCLTFQRFDASEIFSIPW